MTLQKSVASHYHARCAVTALKSVVFYECFLDRAQLTVLCQAFDGGDFTAIGLHGERRQDLTTLPSSNTEQAPHSPTTQST